MHAAHIADWSHDTRGTPAPAVLAVSLQEILWIQQRGLRLHSPAWSRTVCAEPGQRLVRELKLLFTLSVHIDGQA